MYSLVYFRIVSAHTRGLGHGFILNACNVPPTGAVRLQTPLLFPRNKKLYDGSEPACFMDHSGMLVTLPYDLRVSPPHTCARRLIIQLFASAHANAEGGCNQQQPSVPATAGSGGQNGRFPAVIDYSPLCSDLTVYSSTLNACTLLTLDGVCKICRSQQHHPPQEVQFRWLFLNDDAGVKEHRRPLAVVSP